MGTTGALRDMLAGVLQPHSSTCTERERESRRHDLELKKNGEGGREKSTPCTSLAQVFFLIFYWKLLHNNPYNYLM